MKKISIFKGVHSEVSKGKVTCLGFVLKEFRRERERERKQVCEIMIFKSG